MSESLPVKSEGFTALNHHIGHVEVFLPLQLHVPVEMMKLVLQKLAWDHHLTGHRIEKDVEALQSAPAQRDYILWKAPDWSLAMAPAQHDYIYLHIRNTIESVCQGPGVNFGSWALKKRTRIRWTLGRLHTIFHVTFPSDIETRHPSVTFLVSDLHCSRSDWSALAT